MKESVRVSETSNTANSIRPPREHLPTSQKSEFGKIDPHVIGITGVINQ